MIRGWKKLSKRQRKHLSASVSNGNDTRRFQSNIDHQAALERESGLVQCWECKVIARILGFEPEGGWPE